MRNLILLLFAINSFGLTITDEKAIQLGIQWYPEELEKHCIWYPRADKDDLDRFIYLLHDSTGPYHFPLIFKMPNDPNDYVLLSWSDCLSSLYWRLLKTNDGGETFHFVCDIDKMISDSGFWWSLRLVDLTGDNIPELLWEGAIFGAGSQGQGLAIWQWKNGCFRHITPYNGNDDESYADDDMNWGIHSNSFLELDDIDGDNKAEIIIGPTLDKNWGTSPEGGDDITWTVVFPPQVWRFDGTMYVKWYELDPQDPNPIYIPSLGVFHPSTIPLQELSNPGNGKISIFVSDPPGPLTVDDFVKNSFTFNDKKISFKKIWNNKNQPTETNANYEFMGCPVKQFVRKSQGEFQTNPSDPYILSPDLKMEYHFVGKYIELEAERSLVFPPLLEKANKFFEENTQKDAYFASVPVRANFNNGKISQISSFVVIKKTGNIGGSIKNDEKKQ